MRCGALTARRNPPGGSASLRAAQSPQKFHSLIEKIFCVRLRNKKEKFLRVLLCADAQAEPLPTPSPASRDCERPKISSLQTHLHFSPGGFTNKEKFDNIFQDLFIQNRKEG